MGMSSSSWFLAVSLRSPFFSFQFCSTFACRCAGSSICLFSVVSHLKRRPTQLLCFGLSASSERENGTKACICLFSRNSLDTWLRVCNGQYRSRIRILESDTFLPRAAVNFYLFRTHTRKPTHTHTRTHVHAATFRRLQRIRIYVTKTASPRVHEYPLCTDT